MKLGKNLKICIIFLRINNCDISNITDWVHRIQKQCPQLEQLSIMGNPGIKNLFSLRTLTPPTLLDSHSPTETHTIITDYREYILNVLPDLEYLDGSPRHSIIDSYNASDKSPNSSATNSSASIGNCSIGNSSNCSNNQRHFQRNGNNMLNSKTSLTLSFKDIFRLKTKKKSYQSLNTN